MIKYLTLFTAVFVLAGCETVSDWIGVREPSCYERVAVSKISLAEAYESTFSALNGDLIEADKAEDAIKVLDEANIAITNAQPLCAVDEITAGDYLIQAATLLTQASRLLQETEE